MSIRFMIFALVVGGLTVGCVDDGKSTDGSIEVVPEYTDPVQQQPETVGQYLNGDNFKCKSVVLVGVPCLGFINFIPVIIKIANIKILNDVELGVLVNALNNLAIVKGNETNVTTILKDVEITALNVLIKDLDLDLDVQDINVCSNVLSPHGVAQCK